MRLRAGVEDELRAHGVLPGEGETPASLRERLNDAYLEDVRGLRERQRGGEIALRDYARHVEELRLSYPLLALPLPSWTE